MEANWFIDLLRTIFIFLDGIIYPLIGTVYDLLMSIANTNIFTEDIIDLFAEKVYALLGIFMLFKVSFSILTYIVNPDQFSDKSKGFSKMISNIVITLILLVITPWIFRQAMDIQRIVLKDNIIGKVFTSSTLSDVEFDMAGDTMAYETLRAFYYLNTEDDDTNSCNDLVLGNVISDESIKSQCATYMGTSLETFTKYQDIFTISQSSKNVEYYLNQDLAKQLNSKGHYVMNYIPLVSTVAGAFIFWILLLFCLDVAVRSIKLGFLRMVAPVPIISRIDPKKGQDTFNKWVKACTSTYLDLFIRLLAINFAVFVITQVLY